MIEAVEALKNSGRVIVDEEHDWGYQLRFVNEPEYCGKFMILTNDKKGSRHFHKNKKETFICISGEVLVKLDFHGVFLSPGQAITLEPDIYHQTVALQVPSIILEVSTHDDDLDTYRIKEGDKE